MGLFDRALDALGLGGGSDADHAEQLARSAGLMMPMTLLPGGVGGAYGPFSATPGATSGYTPPAFNPLIGAPTSQPGQIPAGGSIKSSMWGSGVPTVNVTGGPTKYPQQFGSGGAAVAPAQPAPAAQTNPYAGRTGLLDRLLAQQWDAGQATPLGQRSATATPGAGVAGIPGGNPFTQGIAVPGGSVNTGFSPQHAAAGTIGDLDPTRSLLRDISVTQQTDPQIMQALRGAATSNLGADTGALSQQFLALMREQARPYEQQQFQGINQNLFSRGRLGADDSVTGEAYRQFARGTGEADVARQLSALQFGSGEAENMFQRGLSASGAYDQLQTSTLGRILGASGGAQDLTRLGTLPLELALQLGIARSNALTGQVQGMNQVAASGTSVADLFGAFLGGGGGAVFGGKP